MDTTITISQSTFIWSILGSTVMATIIAFFLGWIKDFFQSRKKKNEEREEKLYSTLRFYLMLAHINANTGQKLLISRQKVDKLNNYKDINNKRSTKWSEDNKELVGNYWLYAKKIMKCLEEGAQYIKREHVLFIEKLFGSYILRKIVSGESDYINSFNIYDEDILAEQDNNNFIKNLKELYEKIK